MTPLLQTHNLTVGYKQGKTAVPVLRNLDLQLRAGTLVALLGRNGAGKSTLLRALTRDTQPLAGTITVAGKPLAGISQRELSRLVGLVGTDRIQAGALTVTELVALGRQPHTGFLGRMSRSDHEVVDAAVTAVGMTHKAAEMVATLSDGERQKAMIAKALAQETPIIVLDEPTAFLDVASRIETMNLLTHLAHDQGKAVLLSSHDISQSLLLADELWVITHDNLLLTGTTQDMMNSGAMDRIFATTAIAFNPQMQQFTLSR